MKSLLVFLLAFTSLPTLAFAQTPENAATNQTADHQAVADRATGLAINLGNWQLSGEGEYFQSNKNDLRRLTLNPHLEYFFLNRFSAGATLVYVDSNQASTEFRLGPALTWYFAVVNQLAFKLKQSVLWVNPEGSAENYFAGETGVGVDYFVSPTVAVGPSLQGVYYFSGDTQKPDGGFSVRLALSVFL